MATSLTARWRYEGTAAERVDDFDAVYDDAKKLMMSAFATTYSRALQETLYAMGKSVLDAHPEVAEVKFSAPNKHHFLVDLAPFGLENNGEVFIAADRPYGLIEATLSRDDSSDAGLAWLGVPGFV
jgi:urate oxidase